MSCRASCRQIRSRPWPHPRRWSPFGSIGEPQGHIGGGDVAKDGTPNQILEAMMNSAGGMERPKLKRGGALSQALVSLLDDSVLRRALP